MTFADLSAGLCTKLPDFDPEDYPNARPVCVQCPVSAACLESAMAEERGEPSEGRAGIRGGMTPAQRASKDDGSCPDCGRRPRAEGKYRCLPCSTRRRRATRNLENERRKEQRASENLAYSTEDARRAHAAHQQGDRTPWVVTGQRVYERRKKAAQYSRQKRQARKESA